MTEFSEFIEYMAGGKNLTNNHDEKLKPMVHPLTYSSDPKEHPDLRLVPAWVKYARISELVENYKKCI